MNCPTCHSETIVKNGSIHNGKKKFLCKACGRQFVENPENKPISEETKHLIDQVLLEKIPLAGIARVLDISEKWLQDYVNTKYASIPQHVVVTSKKRGV
jgi:insertion element IS1 protein InsB